MSPFRPIVFCAFASLALFLLPGCITNKKWNPAATQPVTVGDPAEATPEYWLNQPPTDQVKLNDFTTLFEAAEDVARSYWFRIDRRDYRSGQLITQPMVSKQWFEPWRNDVATVDDLKESSLNPIRRTVHFQFTQNPDGTFSATPKVLVERYSRVDANYREAFALRQEPTTYWYALRRDRALEQNIADSLRRKLKQDVKARDNAGGNNWSDPSPGRVPATAS